MKAEDDITSPRGTVPLPLEYEPIDLKMSPIAQEAPKQKIDGRLDISSESSTDDDLGAIPIEVALKFIFEFAYYNLQIIISWFSFHLVSSFI